MKESELSQSQQARLNNLRRGPGRSPATRHYDPYAEDRIAWELQDFASRGIKEGSFVLVPHAHWDEPHPAEVVFVGRGQRSGRIHYDDQPRALIRLRHQKGNGQFAERWLTWGSTVNLRSIVENT